MAGGSDEVDQRRSPSNLGVETVVDDDTTGRIAFDPNAAAMAWISDMRREPDMTEDRASAESEDSREPVTPAA